METDSLFVSVTNGERIKTWLYAPEKPSYVLLVLCHGFTGNSSGLSTALAKQLSIYYMVCRFDFRGQGESEGKFASTTITRELEDLEVVITQLRKKFNVSKLVLVGHSFGAAIALLYSQSHHIDGIVSLSGEGDLEKAISLVEFSPGQLDDFKTRGAANVENWSRGGQLDSLNVGFLEDMRKYSTVDAIESLTSPVLFIHGDVDEVVPSSQTQDLYELANDPKSLVMLKGMDHSYGFYSGKRDIDTVADCISAWIESAW